MAVLTGYSDSWVLFTNWDSGFSLKWMSEWLLLNAKLGTYLALYWRKQVTFWRDDDEESFVLSKIVLVSASSMKQ
jgi:hypothetical protein